jgi:asparagine synthase (glutamine-hydrolysing)
MCGILGQVSFKGINTNVPQLSLLYHRGPDGHDKWSNVYDNVYLGHTRLAILEPSVAGRQPMHDASNRFTITFNGEIYNHLELRELLPDVVWRGNSDTETLVELFSAMGLQALELLKGMFAFSLHDNSDDSLLLVRDRLGIKPLWYRHQEDVFQFSSEIRALLVPGEVKLTDQALSGYVAFGRMPEHEPIVEGIKSVVPGTWLKIQPNKKISTGKWWPHKRFGTSRPRDVKYLPQRVKGLVVQAIEEHLLSDVGVGAFLSGGIDSSIIALVAGKELGRRLQTFTVGFPQSDFDERAVARKVALKAGTEHHELEVNSDICLSWVKEAVLNLDIPSVDAINTYIVSKAVRNTGLKVALSGLGGDELFGGYPSFHQVPLLQFLTAFPDRIIEQLVPLMSNSIKDKLQGLEDFNVCSLTSARRRFTSIIHLEKMALAKGIPFIPPPPPELDMMGQISWAEIHGYMIPMLLRDSDQMSMAVGLEIRVPFLDHCLVEEILTIPQKLKKGSGIKPLLVKAFQDDLPSEVYTRPKQGFALPMEEWIRGPLDEFSTEGIMAAADLLSMTEPIRQYENFKRGFLHWTRVWQWCVLGHWLAKQKEPSKLDLCEK